MKKIALLAGFLGLGLGLGLAAVPTAAHAAGDTTPPTLAAPTKASFTVGSPISADMAGCGFSGEDWIYIPESFSWSATDASGHVRYDVAEAWTPGYLVYRFTDSTRTSYSDPEGGINFDRGACGGGDDDVDHWVVTARDVAGNAVSRSVYGHIVDVYQENGMLSSGDRGTSTIPVRYSGTWRTSNFTGYSGGTTKSTTASGASATATVTVPSGEVSHVGLVMAKGPTRGSAKVYIDGVLKATVNTHSASTQSRMILFERSLKAGLHKIKLVNLATSGHRRIDIDAFLTN